MKPRLLPCLFLIAPLAAIPVPAHAGFYTGNNLLEACAVEEGSPNYFERNYECVAYIAGAVDAFNTTREANGLKSCIPSGTTMGDLRTVTVDYLRDHRKERAKSASQIVFTATRAEWPCKKPVTKKTASKKAKSRK